MWCPPGLTSGLLNATAPETNYGKHIMKQKSRRDGISLVEIMLAFLILCTAVFAAAGAISFGHRGTEKDFRRGEALQILVDRLNRLASISFARLDSFLISAGTNEFTFNNPIDGVVLGDNVNAGKHSYRIRAVLKRQRVTFDGIMELDFPNPDYNSASPSSWIFRDRPAETFDGVVAPFVVLKITVMVKPLGGLNDEREISAITFIADMER